MAPSDYELNVLKITEGTEKFKVNDGSICYDLKEPFKISHAINFIRQNKNAFYRVFEGDVKEWLFSPDEEEALISYLASTLIEYQNHRNGFAEQLRKVGTLPDFETLNSFIRTDYIRATHHIKIQVYVNNLESFFGRSFEQPAGAKDWQKTWQLYAGHMEKILTIWGGLVYQHNIMAVSPLTYSLWGCCCDWVILSTSVSTGLRLSYDRQKF